MISADTSTWINFCKGITNKQTEQLSVCLRDSTLLIAPPVLTELLSFQGISVADQELFCFLPKVEVKEGFWERAGSTRRAILKKAYRARTIDCLIAQCCIDSDISLIADDQDFRHFHEFGLRLL